MKTSLLLPFVLLFFHVVNKERKRLVTLGGDSAIFFFFLLLRSLFFSHRQKTPCVHFCFLESILVDKDSHTIEGEQFLRSQLVRGDVFDPFRYHQSFFFLSERMFSSKNSFLERSKNPKTSFQPWRSCRLVSANVFTALDGSGSCSRRGDMFS